ncbi:MAG: peptide chain release factor N(5)-glutamine methyltransferase [Planctomycetia bacterium]|nr:peptide chain release factor N(5)-glutamine methyltransferase [Planctomycetia bacterium]
MSTDQPWTIRRLLDWTKSFLAGKGVDSPRLEAELLLGHALGCPKIALYTRYEEIPSVTQRAAFKDLVQQRITGRPVAYLLGKKEFYSLEFEVGPSVLIPRPDSEWLVAETEALVKCLPTAAVLDLGTGSGCLAVAIAVRVKSAAITAVDISREAVEIASRNATKHKVSDRVRIVQGDLFGPIGSDTAFDVILSNPPYIPSADVQNLDPGVRNFEPHLALDGGPDGFTIINRLLEQAPAVLKPGGAILIEIGHDQADEARRRFAAGGWSIDREVKDNAGHVRVLRGRR